MGRLADKNILITGGNSGIGLAAAQEFDREGARVATCGLNERMLQATKETPGAGSLAVHTDVSNLSDLDTMFATIKREFGHLDGIFVNAGYSEFLLFEDVRSKASTRCVNSLGPQRLLHVISDVFADIENGAGRAVYFPTSTRTRRKSDEKLLRCRHLRNNRQEKRIKRHAIRDLGIGLL